MSNKKKIILCLLLSFFFVFLSSGFVFALEINYPKVPGATPPQDFINTAPAEQILSLYVLYIFNLIIWISGIIAFGAIVYAGIRYLTSAGKPEAILAAREQITAAFLGILLLLSSFIILQVLNPQLKVVQLPKLEPPKIIEKPEIPLLEEKPLVSSIDAELPLGRIIEERIFESYVPPGEERVPRMTRIKENSSTTLNIATELKEANEKLKERVDQCSCGQAKPQCRPCVSGRPCTCDPCKDVRGDIEKIEQEENLPKIEGLKTEGAKTIEETKQLKFELGKLERLENYLSQDCRLWTLQSLREFLIKVDDFKQWVLRQIRVWDEIDTIYWSQREGKWVRDWATFYCQVGGTTMVEQPLQPPLEEPTPAIPGEYIRVIKSCPREAPIGEIIDRTKRLTKLLIERLETLNSLQGEMISAVDRMQVLVSQCTSQVPRCYSLCIEAYYVCIKQCVGSPCPSAEIAQQAQKIAEINQDIEKVVSATSTEEMGIIPIIDNVVSKILEDLELEIRYPMSECIYKRKDRVFFDTQRVIGALDPKGIVIRTACYKEQAFEECLEACYLEEGQEKYRQCLEKCLDQKAEQYKVEEIAWCRHLLNFFCCNVKEELLQ